MTAKETVHYKLYENIALSAPTSFGSWIKTDIQIPKGAIIGVMAKGEVTDTRNPKEWRWQPYQCLRFKVGKEGRQTHIDAGIDGKNPYNLNVLLSGGEGLLHFGMGSWWRRYKNPKYKWGKITAKVIVWEKGRQDRIEADLLDLIRSDPKDQQSRGLVAYMAICFSQTGEYERVYRLHKMIRETPEFEWERVDPQVLVILSDIERSLGRNEKAKAYVEEALIGIRRFGNRYMETTALFRLAMASSNRRQYEEANRLLDQALGIAQSMGNSEAIGTCLRGIGQNLLRMNKPDEAAKSLESALVYFRRRDRWLAQRWCYVRLGECYMRLNRIEDAKKSFESAIETGIKAGDPGPQWAAHSSLGRIAEKEGDDQKAFEHYGKAITIIESTRAKFTDPSLKSLFMQDKLRVYDRMIQLLYKMQRTPEALHYLERARARVMLDMLAEKAFTSKIKEENELLTKEQALRKRIDEISMGGERITFEKPREQEEEMAEVEVQEPEKSDSELERLQAQHKAILGRIERLNPELASLVSINPLKAGDIQALLDPDTALIQYFIGEESRFVFIVTSQKLLALPLEISPASIFQEIQEFRARAVEGITPDRLLMKTYERPLSELYEVLIRPIEGAISGKKNLVIVPHGMLHYLPFQALLSKEGKYLIESFTISYLPSGSVLKYARTKNKGNRVDLFAVGNPSTDLPPLPAAEVEVQQVSVLFKKKLVLTGLQATKTSMKGEGTKYDMVLLSTHGEMMESNPLKSNLRFASSGKDDGRLTVSEIFDMEIKANLVTLSACETALVRGEAGDFPQGDDLVGLSRAFIHAGAPSVVATLWKVSDDSTVELMRRFYRNLQSMSKAEALRKAQLDLMKTSIRFGVQRGGVGITKSAEYQPGEMIECSHPFFWAPFILLGDWK